MTDTTSTRPEPHYWLDGEKDLWTPAHDHDDRVQHINEYGDRTVGTRAEIETRFGRLQPAVVLTKAEDEARADRIDELEAYHRQLGQVLATALRDCGIASTNLDDDIAALTNYARAGRRKDGLEEQLAAQTRRAESAIAQNATLTNAAHDLREARARVSALEQQLAAAIAERDEARAQVLRVESRRMADQLVLDRLDAIHADVRRLGEPLPPVERIGPARTCDECGQELTGTIRHLICPAPPLAVLARAAERAPTADTGPVRRTTGMVCPTCGTDYGPDAKASRPTCDVCERPSDTIRYRPNAGGHICQDCDPDAPDVAHNGPISDTAGGDVAPNGNAPDDDTPAERRGRCCNASTAHLTPGDRIGTPTGPWTCYRCGEPLDAGQKFEIDDGHTRHADCPAGTPDCCTDCAREEAAFAALWDRANDKLRRRSSIPDGAGSGEATA